uniref:Uncharacterized protein n=1 Tax=Timema genevievae TaxID=629358 RepID=A0A7R9JTT4_TIMGE|nr:unnamed protein product [Timema genevievae]
MSAGTFVDRIDPFAKRSLKKKTKKSQGSSRYRNSADLELQVLALLKESNVVILSSPQTRGLWCHKPLHLLWKIPRKQVTDLKICASTEFEPSSSQRVTIETRQTRKINWRNIVIDMSAQLTGVNRPGVANLGLQRCPAGLTACTWYCIIMSTSNPPIDNRPLIRPPPYTRDP